MNDVFNGEGQCVGQSINSGNKRMFEDIWSQDNIPESIACKKKNLKVLYSYDHTDLA